MTGVDIQNLRAQLTTLYNSIGANSVPRKYAGDYAVGPVELTRGSFVFGDIVRVDQIFQAPGRMNDVNKQYDGKSGMVIGRCSRSMAAAVYIVLFASGAMCNYYIRNLMHKDPNRVGKKGRANFDTDNPASAEAVANAAAASAELPKPVEARIDPNYLIDKYAKKPKVTFESLLSYYSGESKVITEMTDEERLHELQATEGVEDYLSKLYHSPGEKLYDYLLNKDVFIRVTDGIYSITLNDAHHHESMLNEAARILQRAVEQTGVPYADIVEAFELYYANSLREMKKDDGWTAKDTATELKNTAFFLKTLKELAPRFAPKPDHQALISKYLRKN